MQFDSNCGSAPAPDAPSVQHQRRRFTPGTSIGLRAAETRMSGALADFRTARTGRTTVDLLVECQGDPFPNDLLKFS